MFGGENAAVQRRSEYFPPPFHLLHCKTQSNAYFHSCGPIKTSGVCVQGWPGPVRAAALGTESFYFVSQIIFKAFKYTHFHNTRIMNTYHIFSQSRGKL